MELILKSTKFFLSLDVIQSACDNIINGNKNEAAGLGKSGRFAYLEKPPH